MKSQALHHKCQLYSQHKYTNTTKKSTNTRKLNTKHKIIIIIIIVIIIITYCVLLLQCWILSIRDSPSLFHNKIFANHLSL